MTYVAPLDEMRFALRRIAGLSEVAALPGYEEATDDLVDAVLEEAGKLAAEVLAPLNAPGDRQRAVYENGVVRVPDGFTEAYQSFVESGWNSLPFETEHGGQGLPWLIQTAVAEMWNSANFAWALCPLLNTGAADMVAAHGSAKQREIFLEKMVSGTWAGTMNLTEPQAGSDLAALNSKAVPDGEDALGARYRISGQKIYITYGEHEMAENIVHMVLARTPDAPAGTKGISLFIVPKCLPNADGTPGQRNDLRCVSIEHKLGIHGSPTCTMAYGDNDGAVGWLVNDENAGLACMFTMMNNARLAVGMQGLAIAERAYQQAVAYARDRVQGSDPTGQTRDRVTIIHHPDVRRMLLTMRAQIEAMRALVYHTAACLDRSKHASGAAQATAQAEVDFLTPITKAWCTDLGVEIASIGVQVHGGMGYVEETGAAQHLRDARIAPIYEGTNGIQAQDLLGRKVIRDGGATARHMVGLVRLTASELDAGSSAHLKVIRSALEQGANSMERATDWLLDKAQSHPMAASAGASPYLEICGIVLAGWLLARGALAATEDLRTANGQAAFFNARLLAARFYAEQILPQAASRLAAMAAGSETVLAMPEDAF